MVEIRSRPRAAARPSSTVGASSSYSASIFPSSAESASSRRVYYARRFDPNTGVLTGLNIMVNEGPITVERIDAARAEWDGTYWTLIDGVRRTFDGDTEKTTSFDRMTARGAHWHGIRPGDDAPLPIVVPAAGVLGEWDHLVPAGWFLAGDDRDVQAFAPGLELLDGGGTVRVRGREDDPERQDGRDLRSEHGEVWGHAWLVTDGKRVFDASGSESIEELGLGHGQMASRRKACRGSSSRVRLDPRRASHRPRSRAVRAYL